jgi:glycosyltransferase involved in cell wall biosynthesis
VWGREYWREYFGWRGLIGAAIERGSMWLPDHIVAEAASTRDRLVEQGVSEAIVSLIPVGVDATAIDAAAPAEVGFDVLYVGRLIEHKRIDVLLEAIARLRATGTVVSCGIVGQGPEQGRLQQLAASLGIDGQVRFLGNVDPHAVVYGLMKASRVFALPSVREGFGLVVVEALLCGTPVIVSDHCDNHAQVLVTHGVDGWLFSPDPDSLAGAIRHVLEAGDAIAPDVPALRAMYDWDRLMQELVGVYGAP